MSERPPRDTAFERIAGEIAFAANTDELVQWERLSERLRSSTDGMPESEHVRLLIAAVNGDSLTAAQWNQLVGAAVLRGGDAWPALRLPAPRLASLEGNLSVLVEGTPHQREKLAASITNAAAANVVLMPTWSERGTRTDRVIARSMYGALAYGFSLLIDSARPWGARLARCRYSECGRFYLRILSRKAGAPRSAYCSPEHYKAADREKARARMAKLRRKRT